MSTIGTASPASPQARRERIEPVERAADVRVQQRELRALVLADDRRELRAQDHRDAGVLGRDDGAHRPLVRRVLERPQQRDDDRVDLLDLDQLLGRDRDRGLVDGRQHDAVAVHPLGHADDAHAFDKRRRQQEPAVFADPVAPRERDRGPRSPAW